MQRTYLVRRNPGAVSCCPTATPPSTGESSARLPERQYVTTRRTHPRGRGGGRGQRQPHESTQDRPNQKQKGQKTVKASHYRCCRSTCFKSMGGLDNRLTSARCCFAYERQLRTSAKGTPPCGRNIGGSAHRPRRQNAKYPAKYTPPHRKHGA